MGIKDLFFKITARDDSGSAFSSVNKRLRETDGLSASVGQRMDRAGKSMVRFGAVGSVASLGVVSAFRDVLGLYDEQARAEAKVAQAVIQTGGAAGLAADQLFEQASALQELTRFGDEEILNKVTAQLLTFKEVTGDVFLGAQEAALDLATVLDGDLQSASIMLGKALNDPAKGLSALGRAGVTFSDAQQDIIKDLARTGDIAGAQKLILEEIASAYGNQAEAARNAGAGIVDAWGNIWGDVKEIVGGVLIDVLPPILDTFKAIAGAFKEMEPEGQKMVVMLGLLGVAIPPVTAAIGLMAIGVNALMGPVGLAVLAIAGLTAAAALLWPEKDKVTQSLDLVTAAMGDEMTQSASLQKILTGDISMSVSAANQKLAEARARLANVQAIYEEKRALDLEAAGRVGVGNMSVPHIYVGGIDSATRSGQAVDAYGNPTPDGSDFFDPRNQAAYEGRVSNAGVSGPIFSDEHAADLAQITENIATLEAAIESAEGGMVTFGNGIAVPIETAERLKTSIAGTGGSAASGGSGGGLTGALKELTGEVDEFGNAEGWQDAKDNMKALLLEGQSFSDTWQNIFGNAMDRVFDLAFSPAWDQLWQNLEMSFSGGGGSGGGGLLNGILGGAGDWVGNVLGLDTGGDVSINGKAGTDRNMTVLRTSDAETVSVRRPGEGGGRAVNVTIVTQDVHSFKGSQAQVAGQMRRALSAADRAS